MKVTLQKGFTLIELAIALSIVALVVGGLAVPMSKRITEQRYVDTQATLDKAVEALVGFAILNRRLPCPDVNTSALAAVDNRDGVEDRTVDNATCAPGTASGKFNYTSSVTSTGASWGDLPWQTLGLAAPGNADAWNNRLRYAVFTPLAGASPSMNNNLALPTTLGGVTALLDVRCGNPNVNIVGYLPAPGCLVSATNTAATNYVVAQNVVFVVYSVGENGWGGTSISSTASSRPFTAAQTALIPDQAANAPELATASEIRRQSVARARTDNSSKAGEFDDLLTFMSANTLAAKLLNAGIYP